MTEVNDPRRGPTVLVLCQGSNEYKVDTDDFTGRESKLLADVANMGIGDAINGIYNPHALAGLVWLVRRRNDRRLTYEDVADEITLRDVFNTVERSEALEMAGDPEPLHPET